MVNQFLHSVESAETKLNRPPTGIEIFCELQHLYTLPVKNFYECAAILDSLLREDVIFANDAISQFSVNRKEGFKTYSEIFKTKFQA